MIPPDLSNAPHIDALAFQFEHSDWDLASAHYPEGVLNGIYASFQFVQELMLPKPNNPESLLRKTRSNLLIPFAVPLDLRLPKITVRSGQMSTGRTSMPKTPIHKYHKVVGGKNEIRISDHTLWPDPPAFYACADKAQPQASLGSSIVFSADRLHRFGSLKTCSLKPSVR